MMSDKFVLSAFKGMCTYTTNNYVADQTGVELKPNLQLYRAHLKNITLSGLQPYIS